MSRMVTVSGVSELEPENLYFPFFCERPQAQVMTSLGRGKIIMFDPS